MPDTVVLRPVPGRVDEDCCCASAPWIPVCTAVTISDCKDESGLLWLDGVLLVPGDAVLAAGLSAGAAGAVWAGVLVGVAIA